MRNLKERGYGSTEHFADVNNLKKEAESLFGKGWESVNDKEEIEKLITLIGADFYEVEIYENSGYYFHVVFNKDKERISELEEQIEVLRKKAGIKPDEKHTKYFSCASKHFLTEGMSYELFDNTLREGEHISLKEDFKGWDIDYVEGLIKSFSETIYKQTKN
jgi:hypothetical protein